MEMTIEAPLSMEAPPPPPTTTAPQPSSSFEDTATVPTTTSSVHSHEATRGVGSKSSAGIAAVDIRASFDVRYDEEGASSVKPPLGPIPGEPEPCTACVLERSRDKQSPRATREQVKEDSSGPWGGLFPSVQADDSGSTDGVTDHHHHTCGRERRESGSSLSLPQHGVARRGSSRGFRHWEQPGHRSRGSGGVNEGAGGDIGDDAREDLTPVTVVGEAGGTLPAAEDDETPLTSRLPRGSGHRSRSGSSMSLGGGTRREGGSGRDAERDGAGSEITWEAFVTNLKVDDVEEGATGAETAFDSQSPLESRRREERRAVQRRSVGGDIRRHRYLRAMTSTAGAYAWNNSNNQGDTGDVIKDGEGDEEGDGNEDDDQGSVSVGTTEPLVPLTATGSFPRMIETLHHHTRPSNLNLNIGRSNSLPAVGELAVPNIRRKMERGINKFNVNPKEGVTYLVKEGLVDDSPESICGFLSSEQGLSKRRLGEYFGRDNPKAQKVLLLFLKRLEFKGKSLDEALRLMVLKFRLPGEAQQMDRIMERFAERYHEENLGVFSCYETAWVLSFGLMILNTDMYNRNIKESDKMTEAQFIKNHRGIDQGNDLPENLLVGMYRRIKTSEIRMDEGDMYESEVITFVAPKRSGWLRKKSNRINWKRYWFVLNDAVLYYFEAPQHQDKSPRCIIPLEGIDIKSYGTTDLSISLKNHQGKVKSVKKTQSGAMEQFFHRSFELRAKSEIERDAWVEALRSEVPHLEMIYASRSLSATPVTSSAATPIGTPSSTGRRSISKFGGSRRRGQQNEFKDKLPRPIVRGWAKTQNKQTNLWVRSYLALFHDVGQEEEDLLHFYGNAGLCDKMIDQGIPTSYLSVPLCDVTRLQLRQEDIDGGRRVIALQTGVGKNAKETAIAIEKRKDFTLWMEYIKHSCPGGVQNISADGTPMPSSIGETAFPSVNTVDSGVDGIVSSVGGHLEIDEHGVDVADISAVRRVRDASGALEGRHQDQAESEGEDEDMAASGRTASTETQPDQDMSHQDMVLSMPSAETALNRLGEADVTAPTTPHVTGQDATGGTRGVREHSSPATDVE